MGDYKNMNVEEMILKRVKRTVVFSDSPVTQTLEDEIILFDCDIGDIVINMLPAATMINDVDFKKISTVNKVTINPNGIETIDENTDLELLGSSPLPSATITTDGSNLWIL